jgi:hypothetical protein
MSNNINSLGHAIRRNQFRAGNGQRLLRGLFREETTSSECPPVYTLKDYDDDLPSLYRLYMDLEDETEYVFATTYLDGYEHWEMLCNCTWFQPYIERWRKELTLKLTAKRLKILITDSMDETSKSKTSSTKYLIEQGWRTRDELRRGRPSKDEVRNELDKQVKEEKAVQEDLARIQEKEYIRVAS